MTDKSLEQLENDYWKEQTEYPTILVKKCHSYRRIPLNNLTIEQIRLLISQNLGLKFLTPLAIDKLQDDILAEGDLYEGDLLEKVSEVDKNYFDNNPDQKQRLNNLIFEKSELIKSEMGEKQFEKLKERLEL